MNNIFSPLRIACFALVAAFSAPTFAQVSSSPVLKIIVAYPAGGAVDALARQLGGAITDKTGQIVIVDNKPGAATSIAAQSIMQARPDGNTVALLDATAIALNKLLYKKLTYDPASLIPVTTVVKFQLALIVPATSPFKTLKDYVDAAKAKPGTIPYASTSAGGPTHLTMERFKLASGIDVNHVAYKGGAPAAQDIAAGQIDSALIDLASAVQLIKAGRIRVLAVTPTRSDIFPNVPTFAESGYPDFVAGAWSGIFVPPKTPLPVILRLNALFQDAAASPKVMSWISSVSLEKSTSTPLEFSNLIKSDINNYSSIVKKIGFSLD